MLMMIFIFFSSFYLKGNYDRFLVIQVSYALYLKQYISINYLNVYTYSDK